MKRKFKILVATSLAVVMAMSLTACDKGNTSVSEASADTAVTKISIEASPEASVETSTSVSTASSVSEEEKPDPKTDAVSENSDIVPVENDEKLKELIAGEWNYCPYLGCEALAISFKADGTYSFTYDDGEEHEYSGEWYFDKLYADSTAPGDLLCLRGRDSEGLMAPGGDYLIDNIAVTGSGLAMKLLQASNGDSVFGAFYSDYAPLFVKQNSDINMARPKKTATFEGVLWHINYNDAAMTFTISPYSDEMSVATAAEYSWAWESQNEIKMPDDISNDNIYRVRITTDEYGDILKMDFYKTLHGRTVTSVHSLDDYLQGYIVEKKDYSLVKNYTVEAYTELPHFIENNEYAKDLNKIIESIEKDYETVKVPEMMASVTEFADEMFSDGDVYSYEPFAVGDVYWEYYGPVSIPIYWSWYMGGVYNRGFLTVNYDPVNKKYISLEEHLGLTLDETRRMIKDAMLEQHDVFCIDDEEYLSKIDEITDFKYTFDETGLYVFFDSYELNLGSQGFEVKLK